MEPSYKSHFIAHRIKLGGDTSGLDPKIESVLRGVSPERIISITHTFAPGMLTVLIVLRLADGATAA
jgi:hypothetical protein